MIARARADTVGNGIFLIAIGLLYYYHFWWPGILLAVWSSFSTRQLLTKRFQDFLLTTILLLSLFFIVFFQLSFELLMPLIFILGGSYLVFKEFFYRPKEATAFDPYKEEKEDV